VRAAWYILLDNLPAVIDWCNPQDRACIRAKHLPWHDIGVMLEPGEHNLIAFADIAVTQAWALY
jgi:hypothetical protein